MRTIQRVMLLGAIVTFLPVLTACSSGFDPDKLDVFGLNEKKKLPGERKEVFPGGVPGVSQGIPPEYVKGNQPPPDAAAAPGAEPDKKTAAVEPEPKPKPKPKRPPKPPTQVTVQPAPQQQPAPWPQDQQPAQQQSQAPAPWPSSPQPGTFSR
ncbi:MAG TPA: hypothetical protein VLU23_09065 [Pseudolabrys sp.]|nr:hypothetical protein [Pseudolabrys sp.]